MPAERFLALKTDHPRVRAGRQQDTEAPQVAPAGADRFDIPVQFKLRYLGQQEFRAEALRLPTHCFGQVRAAGALHPGIVDHLGRNRDLPAELRFLHNQYTVTRTRQI